MGSFDIFFTIPISRQIPIRKPACSRLFALSGRSQFQRDAELDRGNLGGINPEDYSLQKILYGPRTVLCPTLYRLLDAPLRLLSFRIHFPRRSHAMRLSGKFLLPALVTVMACCFPISVLPIVVPTLAITEAR